MQELFAISGTTAAKVSESEKKDEFDAYSLVALIEKIQNSDNLGKSIDKALSDADYLIIAYGLNDYFHGTESQSEKEKDIHSYEGSLAYAVEFFEDRYPGIRIVLIGQTYCQYYSYGIVEADSDTSDFGGGVGMDYVDAAAEVADKYDIMFINQYYELNMNEWNGRRYLEDATHLNKKGREAYAKVVAKYLTQDI